MADLAPPPDRRSRPRRECHRPCLVRFDRVLLDGVAGAVGLKGDVLDLSRDGVCLAMRGRLEPGAELEVGAVGAGLPDVGMAVVVRVAPWGHRWGHGCVLLQPLGDEALHAWQARQ